MTTAKYKIKIKNYTKCRFMLSEFSSLIFLGHYFSAVWLGSFSLVKRKKNKIDLFFESTKNNFLYRSELLFVANIPKKKKKNRLR